MENVKIADLRSLDDFLLTTSRFQVPDLENREKYFNRIVANLLYYQTNYFLTSLIIFTLVTLVHPQSMVFGIITISISVGVLLQIQKHKEKLKELRQQHPKSSFGVLVVCACIIWSGLGSVMVVLLGIGLPICFSILHASLRLRNVKNKLVNASEALGIAKMTPMGLILNGIGVDSDIKMF